jgi:hypothetical protein
MLRAAAMGSAQLGPGPEVNPGQLHVGQGLHGSLECRPSSPDTAWMLTPAAGA